LNRPSNQPFSSVLRLSAHTLWRSVIRVVLQFLKENSLVNTFNALVQETNVHLNTVENPAALASAIKAGEWDVVMREVATVELCDSVQADLFEHIALELLDLRELDAARKLLKTRPLRAMQNHSGDRFARLEGVVQRGEVTEWPGGSKKKNRKLLAKTVVADLSTVPPSRLLSVVGQALKWQRHMGMLPPGTSFSVFRDEVRKRDASFVSSHVLKRLRLPSARTSLLRLWE
jgi:WD40 repeat-containing protein SMU1